MQQSLAPISSRIHIAFIYGSVAKQEDTAESDLDLMVIGDNLTYADFFQLLTNAEQQLDRKINPTIYTPAEWTRKLKAENNFLTKIMQQPKIFIIGAEDELGKIK